LLTNAASNHMSSRTFYPVSMSDPRLSENDFDYNVLDGIDAIIKTTKQRESCMWTYLRDNPPSDSTGYMFSDNPGFGAIMNNMQVGHSGASYAWTMRNLQFIASHGMDAYIDACSPKSKKELQTHPQVSAGAGAVADL
jgi:hypothetical protein